MTIEDWTAQYHCERPKYERLTRKLKALLEEILEREGIRAVLESRTKELESFKDKIMRPGKTYSEPLSEVSDLSGVRAILYSISDVARVAHLIHREFTVDSQRSVNKLDQLDPDRFGYISQHFIVKISDARSGLLEWRDVSGIWAEIQIRTVLQHAWATVEHFLVYKNESDAPKLLRRRLSRLSALFEMADEELERLIQDRGNENAKYRSELDQGNAQIEINVDSLRAYIQNSIELRYWFNFLRHEVEVKIDENDWGDLSRDVRLARYFRLELIADIDHLLASAHGWGEQFLAEYFRGEAEELGITPQEIYVVINGPITILMIASYAERITRQVLEEEFGWGDADALLRDALAYKSSAR